MKKILFLLAMIFTLISCSSTTVTKKGLIEKYSLNKESAHNWEESMSKVMVAEATNPDWYGEENPLVNFRKQGKMSEKEYYQLTQLLRFIAEERRKIITDKIESLIKNAKNTQKAYSMLCDRESAWQNINDCLEQYKKITKEL